MYQMLFKNRESDSHGGVAIYIKNGLEYYEIDDERFNSLKSEQIWCVLKVNKKDKILLSCIYRPPRSKREVNQEINKTISIASDLVSKKKYNGLLITGDFNYSDIIWSDDGGDCIGSGRASSVEFLETIDSNFLTQAVKVPTFMNNTLDLIILDEPNRIFDVNVGPPVGTSKVDRLHATLTWEYYLNGELNISSNSKILYAKADFSAINKFLNDVDWNQVFYNLDANQMYENFLLKYNEAIAKFVPKFIQSSDFNAKKV